MDYNYIITLVSVAAGFYLAACAICASGKKQKFLGVASVACFIFVYALSGQGFDAVAYFGKLLN
ncbi:MAG: hypothetical protein R6W92_16705 [Desulfocurvibacter africanus]